MTPRPAVLRVAPAADRGPLLSPDQVADLIGGVSPAWVRRTVPGKIVLGQRTVRWYEGDVRAWIEAQPNELQPKPRHACAEPGCRELAAASRTHCPAHHKARLAVASAASPTPGAHLAETR